MHALAAAILIMAAKPSLAAADPPVHEHWFLEDYRGALSTHLSDEEQPRLRAIDTSHTDRAPTLRLLCLAADRVARKIAPLALEALHLGDDAARLRRLRPIRDKASARQAQKPVAEAAQRAAPPVTDATTARPLLPCELPILYASLLVQQVVKYRRAEDAGGAGAASAVCGTIAVGADRAVVVDLGLGLLVDLVAAARRR